MTRPRCTFPHNKGTLASTQDLFYLKTDTEKMAATKESESDALRATVNKWCAVFEYAQSECVVLHIPPRSHNFLSPSG